MISPRDTWHLDTAHIGRRVLFFDQLDSTNTSAALLATDGVEDDGLVVIADFQTAGRGQYGRVWQSQPGSSLLMSVALRPPSALCRPVVLTAFAAVALGEAILSLTGAQARIKWPNDLLIRGKKVCGILIENTSTTVIGIGLNLNQSQEHFTEAGLPDATSLFLASGRQQVASVAAKVVIQQLDAEYGRLLGGERVAVEADWKWRIGLLGKHVTAELNDGSFVSGRLHEMSFDGLELDTGEGCFRLLVPETVRHLRPFAESV
jgi:BirA family biotin operon repressor/biotin-[acetyl-CoA-carboxylase] ligase